MYKTYYIYRTDFTCCMRWYIELNVLCFIILLLNIKHRCGLMLFVIKQFCFYIFSYFAKQVDDTLLLTLGYDLLLRTLCRVFVVFLSR